MKTVQEMREAFLIGQERYLTQEVAKVMSDFSGGLNNAYSIMQSEANVIKYVTVDVPEGSSKLINVVLDKLTNLGYTAEYEKTARGSYIRVSGWSGG